METIITFTPNRSKKTFTIRKFDENGRLYAKYRTFPLSKEEFYYFSTYATQSDMENFLRNNEYDVIK